MRRFAPALLILAGMVLGARVYAAFFFAAPDGALYAYAGRSAVVEGRIADDIDVRATSVRIVVEAVRVNGAPVRGRILASLPREAEVSYGGSLTLRGALERPEPFDTDGGRTFDYPGYLKARGIALVMPRAQMRAYESGGWSLRGTLYALKHGFEKSLERVMREPNVSLMEGLLLGEKSGLPPPLADAFVATGLIHIVVLSGYNIGVVAEWVSRALALVLRRRAALVAAGIALLLFALMAGGGMATARAALMGLIALLARYLNRPTAALRALGVAGVVMVAWNPYVLIDAGFILSMLATFGLITLSLWVESVVSFIPEGAARSIAGTTIAVQIFILPALLYFTGVLSFVSVPLNVLVLPFVPLAMLLGFVAGALAWAHPYVGLLPGMCADALLSVMIKITEAAAGLPLAAVVVPAFSAWVAAAAYVPLTAFAIWASRRSAVR